MYGKNNTIAHRRGGGGGDHIGAQAIHTTIRKTLFIPFTLFPLLDVIVATDSRTGDTEAPQTRISRAALGIALTLFRALDNSISAHRVPPIIVVIPTSAGASTRATRAATGTFTLAVDITRCGIWRFTILSRLNNPIPTGWFEHAIKMASIVTDSITVITFFRTFQDPVSACLPFGLFNFAIIGTTVSAGIVTIIAFFIIDGIYDPVTTTRQTAIIPTNVRRGVRIQNAGIALFSDIEYSIPTIFNGENGDNGLADAWTLRSLRCGVASKTIFNNARAGTSIFHVCIAIITFLACLNQTVATLCRGNGGCTGRRLSRRGAGRRCRGRGTGRGTTGRCERRSAGRRCRRGGDARGRGGATGNTAALNTGFITGTFPPVFTSFT
ncbi:MAG: hypothetical protein WC875_05905 [Candidatus Absconditabacterales bacterium]